MIKGFKEFLMRGNVVDLAVAVVIGAAFAKIVQGFLDGFINPLIAAIFGQPSIAGVLSFEINDARFSIGVILDAVLNFIIVAAAIYFVVIMPLKKLQERRARGQEPEPVELTTEEQLLTEIRDALRDRSGPTT